MGISWMFNIPRHPTVASGPTRGQTSNNPHHERICVNFGYRVLTKWAVTLSMYQYANLSIGKVNNLSSCHFVNMSTCQFYHFTRCAFDSLSSCQIVTLPIRHFVKLGGIHVGLGGIHVGLGASAAAICRAGRTCGGLDGIVVALGASALAIFRAVCYEDWRRRPAGG